MGALAVYGALPTLTVDLNGAGTVLSAHRLWPHVVEATRQRLTGLVNAVGAGAAPGTVSPRTATATPEPPLPACGGAPPCAPAPVFTVTSVQLVYTLAPGPSRSAGTLQPAYLLQGQLQLPAGGKQPHSMLLAAVPTSGAGQR
jgi:hypothetical protein